MRILITSQAAMICVSGTPVAIGFVCFGGIIVQEAAFGVH